MIFSYSKHILSFQKPAKTSRGEYIEKPSWLLQLSQENTSGVGEASPLWDLSVDGKKDIDSILRGIPHELSDQDILNLLEEWQPGSNSSLPSLRFALHCAYLDLKNGGSGTWCNTNFTHKTKGIPINGLVWMNDIESMEKEALSKIKQGFRCIKFKVGALDFDSECKLLERIRKEFTSNQLEIRLDANGAFSVDTALEQLKDLSRFNIHSIEQPIYPGLEIMEKLCRESAIDIALDEELIGMAVGSASVYLSKLKPKYLILKPTLLGGLDICDAWIKVAESAGIGWWSTSALEGNIGLYAIAQWVSEKENLRYQGLGTGSLFVENFPSKTEVKGEELWVK